MKTSFYFVVWILIYPLLGLFHSSFVDQNAFIIALLAVWGLSWLLNRTMPETLAYDRASTTAPILEDVYTGNIGRFRKHITRQAIVEAITSFYFLITTLVILLSIADSGGDDWLALIIFAMFTFSTISQSIKLLKAYSRLKANPTKAECERTFSEIYGIDYSAYAEERERGTFEDMLPPKPSHFKAFQIFSMIVSGICAALGLVYIVLGLLVMFGSGAAAAGAIAGMYFLYGSLAAYFGVKDLISGSASVARSK